VSVQLLKFLDLDWETARGYLREDLDHLETALNAGGIGSGSGSGSGSSDLAQATGRLAFAHLVAATAGAILVGRMSGAGGDFGEISLGAGLTMTGSVLSAAGAVGPAGPAGPAGPGISVFQQQAEPLTAIPGDMWISG
jgi:hypothetical protein